MIDLRELWDFSDPSGSEARFQTLRCEVATQIARTHSLRKDYGKAHAYLDEVQNDPHLTGRAKTLYHLERGRTFNSAGDKDSARREFEAAMAGADEDLAIDALHMLAIVSEPAEAMRLNQEALARSRASVDPRARRWEASLLNNLGWGYHDLGEFEPALACFEAAVPLREGEALHVAKWCVARCLRSMGRGEEALAILRALDASDPYVVEEIAANGG
jgi:tetratricopeptide (TPR) repeat protein